MSFLNKTSISIVIFFSLLIGILIFPSALFSDEGIDYHVNNFLLVLSQRNETLQSINSVEDLTDERCQVLASYMFAENEFINYVSELDEQEQVRGFAMVINSSEHSRYLETIFAIKENEELYQEIAQYLTSF